MTTKSDKIRGLFLSALMVMSVFAGAAAFAGTAAANHSDDYDDSDTLRNVGNTDIVFQGQIATYESATGDTITLYDDGGNYIDEYEVDGQGHVAFSTNGLEGQYHLGGQDSDAAVASFQVVTQSFPVSPDSVNVTTQDSSLEFSVGETNRANQFWVNVTGEAVGTNTDFNEDGYHIQLTENSGPHSVDLASDVSAGEYDVNVDVVDTTASESISVNVTEGDVTYSLANPYPSDERGDVGEFTVQLENTNSAWVQFGSSDVNYAVAGSVTDSDGDGEVTVQVHTYQTDSAASQVLTVAGEDDISDQTYVNGNGPLSDGQVIASGDYGITVYDEQDGSEETFGTFVLNERSTDAAQTWVAPESASFSDAASVYDNVAEGDTVAVDNYAVIQVEASGLYDYIDSSTGLDTAGVSMTISQTNLDPNQEDHTISPTSVVTDAENNTLFAIVDTSQVDVEAGQEYQATFEIDGSSNKVVADGETESVNTTFSIASRSVSFDTNRDDVYAVPNDEAEVTGTSTLAPGTEFQVTARSTAANLLQSRTVTVQDDGTWSANFDFSDVDNGTEFQFTNSQTGDTASALVDENAGEQETTTTEETTTTTEETTTTTEETTTTTTTTEDTTTTTEDTTTTEEENDGGIPGFGVSVALVAIIAAALLALRRSN